MATILIVDNNLADSLTYRMFLQQAGMAYDVLEASTGREALALATDPEPDCILLKYDLPDMNGLEVLAQLGGLAGRVVLVTGVNDKSIALRAMRLGAGDFLYKGDITPQNLTRAVQLLLGNRSSPRPMPLKVAYVHSDADNLYLIQQALQDYPFGLVGVESRAQLTKVIDNCDVLLAELDTPDFPSLSILDFAQAHAQVPVVILAAEPSVHLAVESLKRGATDFLSFDDADRVRLPDCIQHVYVSLQAELRQAEAEAALRTANARLRTVFDASPDAVLIAIRETGQIVAHNERAVTMLGYPSEWFAAHTIADVERGLDYETDADPTYIHHINTADGIPIPIEATFAFMDWGGTPAVLAFLRDVTEREQALDLLDENLHELVRSNQDLETFAYVASHDLKAPLRGITGHLELLVRRYGHQLDDRAMGFVGMAVDNAKRMDQLIEGILAYSRVNRDDTLVRPVDIDRVRERVMGLLGQYLAEASATVNWGPMPTVLGYETQLGQLFLNLINNGVKFHRPNVPPVVDISAQLTGEMWTFSVHDNGIGIAPEHHHRVFALFQRLHTVDEYEGAGIGLALCQRIVERHGGKIDLESTVDEGTTFYFSLPAVMKRNS